MYVFISPVQFRKCFGDIFYIHLDINGSISVSCVIDFKPRRPFGCTLVVPANEFRESMMWSKLLNAKGISRYYRIIPKTL